MKLNKKQLAVLEYTKGNAVVQAGPGTGKTTTLIAYAENLVNESIATPDEILILMFNVSVKDEIKDRQGDANNQKAIVHTFHSFGLSIIRSHYKTLGFTAPPTQGNKGYTKNQVTFKEMLSLPLELAKSHPAIFKKEIAKYKYLLVDEVQDINKQQMQLIIRLSKLINNTLLFGDKKQAINGFLNNDINYWERLETRLRPRPKQFQLTITHRLPEATLPFINRVGHAISRDDEPLVTNSKKIIYKKIKSKNKKKNKDTYKNDQAEFIASRIKKLIEDKGVQPKQIVCLGNTRKQLSQLYNALDGYGLHTDRLFINRTTEKHLLMVREILSLSLWYREHKRQRNHTLHKEFDAFIKQLLLLLGTDKASRRSITQSIKDNGLEGFHVNSADDKLYRDLLSFRKTVKSVADSNEPERAIQIVISFLSPLLKRQYDKKGDKTWKLLMRQDLSDLKVISRRYDCLSDDVIDALRLPPIQKGDRVQLSTCNHAKGKEWDYVFVIHVVEGVFPHHKSLKDNKKLAKERMKFYVAITRHRKRLCIIKCPIREIGYTRDGMKISGKHFSKPSQFMKI